MGVALLMRGNCVEISDSGMSYDKIAWGLRGVYMALDGQCCDRFVIYFRIISARTMNPVMVDFEFDLHGARASVWD